MATANCDIDDDLMHPVPARQSPRFSESIIGGLVLAEIAAIAYAKLKARFDRGRRPERDPRPPARQVQS